MADNLKSVDDLIPVEYRSILERTEQRKIEGRIASMSIGLPIAMAVLAGIFAVCWWLDSLSSFEPGSINWLHGPFTTILGSLCVVVFIGAVPLSFWARNKAERKISDLDFQQTLDAVKKTNT